MNKRISTMFASFLLMAGVAFAADGTTYSQKEAKPTAVSYTHLTLPTILLV